MKKIALSTTAALLLSSTLAIAGGDFGKAVEPVVDIPVAEVAPAKTGFYAGLGYACIQTVNDEPNERYMGNGIQLSAGYNFNQYIAVEGRVTASVGDINYQTWYGVDEDLSGDFGDITNFGLYLKPQYTINMFKVYGLVGFGQLSLDNGTSYSDTGLQYGAGVSASVTDNIDIYVDYRRLYDDTGFDDYTNSDLTANSWSLGVTYNF